MVILKKTSYVEARELGMADTLLQIGITWCIGILIILFRHLIHKWKYVDIFFAFVGGISYELYLSHVIPLDWLNENPSVKRFLLYGCVCCACVFLITIERKMVDKYCK